MKKIASLPLWATLIFSVPAFAGTPLVDKFLATTTVTSAYANRVIASTDASLLETAQKQCDEFGIALDKLLLLLSDATRHEVAVYFAANSKAEEDHNQQWDKISKASNLCAALTK